ncbi:hypothetical protein [Streptomyces sp. NPDC051994]|uniref:hypothetical protein n=1 Tax=Streptomyces sp. NPDC051994 TaxID=3155287 RepID=UPI003427B942
MTATITAPDIRQQLEGARREATKLRTELDRVEGELAQAAEAHDYGRAGGLQERADGLRPGVLYAEAQVRALQDAVQGLRDHEAERQAAAVAKELQERCDAIVSQSLAEEKAVVAQVRRLVADAQESLRMAASKLREALAVETRVGELRQVVARAEIEAGRREPSLYGPVGSNWVESAIADSAAFREILRTLP